MEQFDTFKSGSWHGQCATAWEPLFHNVEKWLADNPGDIVVHYPCREVRRINTPKGVVYLKLIRALTDKGLARKEMFSYLKWVLRPSRAIGAWRVSVAMEKAGLECPVPLLAARKREGGYPTDIIVTPEVPFPDCWQNPPGASPSETAAIVAQAACKLHQAGFAHGDFILRNLCHDTSSGVIAFLDNDRTWQPPAPLRKPYQRRNLEQMAYSIASRFAASQPARAFLEKYANLANWPDDNTIQRILMKATARYNSHRERRPLEI